MKLYAAFGTLVVVVSLLGCVGWSRLAVIGRKVAAAGDAEQLIKLSAAGRMAEKDFMLRGDPAALEAAKEGTETAHQAAEALKGSLDRQEDLDAVDHVAGQFDAWLAALKDYADREGQKSLAEQKMVAAADAASAQCAKLRDDQKALLATEQRADAERRTDMLWKADAAQKLLKLASAAQVAQLNYTGTKDLSFVQANHAAVTEIEKLCAQLKDRFQNDQEKRQIEAVLQAGKDYGKTFDHWVKTQGEIERAQAVIAAAAASGQEQCDAIQQDQKRELAEMLKAGGAKDDAALTAQIANADDAARLAALMSGSRVGELSYLLTTDPKHLAVQQEAFEKLVKLTKDLKSRMKDKANLERMTAVAAAVNKYDDSLIQYVTGFKSQRDDSKTMAAKAQAFAAQCEAIHAAQRQELDRTVKLGQELLTDRLNKAEEADGLARLLVEARVDERDYARRGDPKSLTTHRQKLDAVLAMSERLKSRFKEKENLDSWRKW